MRVKLTAIERLNVAHPGAQLDVDKMLDEGRLLADIQALLLEKYHTTVSWRVISKYNQKRRLPSLQRIRDRMERSQAIIRVIQKEGDADFARAWVFEQLDEAAARGDRLSPERLLLEQRLRMGLKILQEKVDITRQQAETDRQRLDLEVEKLKQQRDLERLATAAITASGRSFSIDEVNRIRERVFGLPPIDPDGDAEPRGFDQDEALRKISALIGVGGEPEERVEGECTG